MRQEYILNRVECCMKCGKTVPKGQLKDHVCPAVEKQASWIEKNKLKRAKEEASKKKSAKKDEIADKSIKDLKDEATKLGIENCMQMPKTQLVEEIKKAKLDLKDASKEK